MKRKTERLLQRLNNLQGAIYHFQSELEERKTVHPTIVELIGNSGFELDTAIQEMEEALDIIKLVTAK